MPHITLDQAQAAKRIAKRQFGQIGKVTGVGITRVGRGYAVKVNLSAPIGRGAKIPADIDGVPVRVEVTGMIRSR